MYSGRCGVAVNIVVHLVVGCSRWSCCKYSGTFSSGRCAVVVWSCCKYSGTFSSGGCIVVDVELL